MWRLTKIIVAILVVLAGFNFALTSLVNSSSARSLVVDYIQQETDLTVSLNGDIKILWHQPFSVHLDNIDILNQKSSDHPYLARFESIRLKLSLAELLMGQIQVETLQLERPQVWLNVQSNFATANNSDISNSAKILLSWLAVSEFSIADGTVWYVSPERDMLVKLDRFAVRTSIDDAETVAEIDMRAEVNDTPLNIRGRIGNLDNLFNGNEVNADLSGFVGGENNPFRIYGVVDDLLGKREWNVNFEGHIAQLNDFSHWVNYAFPDYANVSYSGRLQQTATNGAGIVAEIDLLTEVDDTPLNIQGKVSDLHNLFNGDAVSVDLSGFVVNENNPFHISGFVTDLLGKREGNINLEGSIAQLSDFSRWVDDTLPDYVSVSYDGRLQPTAETVSLLINNVELASADKQLRMQVQGQIADVLEMQGIDIGFSAEGYIASSQVGVDSTDAVNMSALQGKITGSKQKLAVDLENADIFIANLHIQGVGLLDDFLGEWRTGLRLTVEQSSNAHDDTGSLSNGLAGEMELVKVDNRFHLNNIVVSKDGDKILQGVVSDLSGDLNAQLEFDYALPFVLVSQNREKRFSQLVDNLRIRGTANYRDDQISIDGLVLNSITVNNRRSDILAISEDSIQLGDSIDGLLSWTLPFRASTTLNRDNNAVSLNDVSVAIHDETLSLDITGSILDLSHWVTDLDFDLRVHDVAAIFNRLGEDGDPSSISATGNITGLAPLDFSTVDISFTTPHISSLWPIRQSFFKRDIPAQGDIKLSTKGNQYLLDINTRIAGSDFSGDLTVVRVVDANQNSIFAITGEVDSNYIDLREMLFRDYETVFSTKKYNLALLPYFGLNIAFNAELLKNGLFTLQQVAGTIVSDNDGIGLQLTGASGEGKLDMSIDSKNDGGYLVSDFRAKGTDLDLRIWTKLNNEQFQPVGKIDIDVVMTGQGVSTSDILSNANGWIKLDVDDAQIRKGKIGLLSDGLFLNLFGFLKLWETEDRSINVNCGALNVAIREGRINSRLAYAVETDTKVLLGSGEVDFRDESLYSSISLKNRTGLSLKSNLAQNLINISGSLSEPKAAPDTKGVLQTGATIGVAVASGGVSLLLSGFRDVVQTNQNMCGLVSEQSFVDVNE